MNPYLTDLIQRLQDDAWQEGMTSSEELTSWKACRETEKLTETSYIPELIAYIESEKNLANRKEAYYILATIVKNTSDETALQYLINRCQVEKNNGVLIRILSRLEKIHKPKNMDLSPIFDLITSHQGEFESYFQDNEAVRNEAIFCLRNTENPATEPLILNLIPDFEKNNDDFALWRCLAVLQNIGTQASIPTMERMAGSKKTELAAMALFFLMNKGDETQLPIFEKFIQEGRNKDVALLGLTKLGNETHISLIIKRIKEVLSRKRSGEILIGDLEDNRTEITHGLEFLQKYAETHPEIPKLIDFIKTKKWDKLFEEEQEFLMVSG